MNVNRRIIELLRTLDDARVAWEVNAAGGGWGCMPSIYVEGSYAELERRLAEMRDRSDLRRYWWHVVYRYRYGTTQWIDVPVRATRYGLRLQIPRRSEVLAAVQPASWSKTKRMRVLAYSWPITVNEERAVEGISQLAGLMYDGKTQRVRLPDVHYRRAMGLPLHEERRQSVA